MQLIGLQQNQGYDVSLTSTKPHGCHSRCTIRYIFPYTEEALDKCSQVPNDTNLVGKLTKYDNPLTRYPYRRPLTKAKFQKRWGH
jgi:hypothetical protein